MQRLPKNGENHHTLFCGSPWESMPQTRKLRRLPSLIVPMDKQVEEALHQEISTIPVLDHFTAVHTYNNYEASNTYIGSIHNLMRAIEIGSNHRKSTRLEKQLAQLTIYALELQVPFIREGQLRQDVRLKVVA